MNAMSRTIHVFVVLTLLAALCCPALLAQELEPLPAAPAATPDFAARDRDSAAAERYVRAAGATARAGRGTGMTERAIFSQASLFGSSTAPVLVVPAGELAPDAIAAVSEDMTIMSRIINDNVNQAAGGAAPGTFMFTGSLFHGHSPGRQATFIEGFGALFSMQVDILLAPAADVEEQPAAEPQQDVDPVWEQMRQELYEPGQHQQHEEEAGPEYDARKVEDLKAALIKSLRHAGNISRLGPNDSVVITVTGAGSTQDMMGMAMYGQRSGRGMTITVPSAGMQIGGAASGQAPTVLVVRAGKGDIDAFAAGDLTVEQFTRQVRMVTYAQP